MGKFERIILWLITVSNALLCLIILCRTCPRLIRPENLGFDYLGVIVGILSFLIAILLGWQIYSVLDIKKTVGDIKSHSNKTQEETMARAYLSIMNQTSYIVEGRKDSEDCFNAISNGLYACKHFHLAGNIQECDKLLRMIANLKREYCILSKKQISDLMIIIGQLKECKINIDIVEQWLSPYLEDENKRGN